MYTLLSQRADISPVWFPTVPMRFPKRSKGRHCDNSSLFKTSQNQFKLMQNSCFSNTVFFPFQLKTFRTFSLSFLLSVRICSHKPDNKPQENICRRKRQSTVFLFVCHSGRLSIWLLPWVGLSLLIFVPWKMQGFASYHYIIFTN